MMKILFIAVKLFGFVIDFFEREKTPFSLSFNFWFSFGHQGGSSGTMP